MGKSKQIFKRLRKLKTFLSYNIYLGYIIIDKKGCNILLSLV